MWEMTSVPVRQFEISGRSRNFAELRPARVKGAGGRLVLEISNPLAQVLKMESSGRGPIHLDADILDAQRGDARAFNRLVLRCKHRVLSLVSRFARNAHELEELAQDVFIDVHRSLSRFRGEAPLEHWISRIAVRRCRDHLRCRYRRRWLTSLEVLRERGFEPEPVTPQDPRVELLRLALFRLRPDRQTVLTLLELEGYSVSDTAAMTGWSESNVKVRAHRARRELRRIIERITSENA